MWRNAEIAHARAVEERKAQAAALRDHRHLAAERPFRHQRADAYVHRRAEGRAERGGDIGEAFRVGAAHRHVVALRGGADRFLHAGAGFARFLGEARGQNDGGLDAGATAAFELVRHVLRRDDQDGEIGRLRQVGDRCVGLAALHFRRAAADRIDSAGVRVAEHHFQDAAAQAFGIGRGADHGDRSRPEQF